MSEVQREISIIAYVKWNKGITLKYSELRKELISRGLKPSANNRGLGRQIKTAYDCAIQEDNQGIADCIANCFTDEDGKHIWKR